MRSTSPRAAPTLPACDIPALPVCAMLSSPLPSTLSSVDEASRDLGVALDAPVAKERPIPANFFQLFQVHFADQDLLAIMRALHQHASERVRQKRRAPEVQSLSARCHVAAHIAVFMAYAIHH